MLAGDFPLALGADALHGSEPAAVQVAGVQVRLDLRDERARQVGGEHAAGHRHRSVLRLRVAKPIGLASDLREQLPNDVLCVNVRHDCLRESRLLEDGA
jgi:hypothetical protein